MGAPLLTTPAAGAGPAPEETQRLTESLERQLVGTRSVLFRTTQVQPPAALYVTQDDGLYVLVSNVQAGLGLSLTATVLLPDGRVQANAWSVVPTSDGSQNAFLFPLAESFLLNVSIQPVSGVRYGQTWAFVCVRRGGLASGVNLQTLISSSVDSFGGPTWPGGSQRQSVEGPGLFQSLWTPSVAAGTAFVYTVPTYARVRVHTLAAVFNTSATAGSRNIALSIFDNNLNTMYYEELEATMAASQSGVLSWGLSLGWAQTTFPNGCCLRSLPDVQLMPSFKLKLSSPNILAGDQFVNIGLLWEQWFSF